MLKHLKDKIWSIFVNWLVYSPETPKISPNDFEVIRANIRPGDVLLVEGKSRVGAIIKNITRSSWSHSAICVGRLDEIDELRLRELIHQHYDGPVEQPLLVEAEIDRGTVVTPLSFYENFHVRIARPIGLSECDAKKVCAYMIERLGSSYDVKQLLDLARFLLPWWLFVPRSWHSSLFEKNAGLATRNVCSSLIAEALQSVKFPILPLIERSQDGGLRFYKRNPKLYTPRDFDYSPFFKIFKFPLLSEIKEGRYSALNWRNMESDDPRRINFLNSEEIIFVAELESNQHETEAHLKSEKILLKADSNQSPKNSNNLL